MRPLFSVRFVAALLGLALVVGGLWAIFLRGDDDGVSAEGPTAPEQREHRVDLIQRAIVVQADGGFDLVDGRTANEMQIALDSERTMAIAKNTPGLIDCPAIAELGGCVVVADLLGDAVVWFALISSEPRNTVTLPAVVELRDGNRVLLANGWDVARAAVVERKCPEDSGSLGAFVRTHGEAARTTFSLDEQRVVRVTCVQSEGDVGTPTTTG
jgi:hypothetical protein